MADTTTSTTCASMNKILLTPEYTCSESCGACDDPSLENVEMSGIFPSSSSMVSIGSIDHAKELGAKILFDCFSQVRRPKEVSATDDFSSAVEAGRQFQREERYEDAILSFRKALLCKNRTITMESRSVQATFASTLFYVGMMHAYTQHQDPLKALEAFELCLQMSRACSGEDHPSVTRVLYEIGIIYELLGEPAEALDLFSEAIVILLPNAMRLDNSQLKEMWTSLCRVQVSLGQTEDAQSSFNEAAKL
jgi:tetratricopeptide (TPR) repeat protein